MQLLLLTNYPRSTFRPCLSLLLWGHSPKGSGELAGRRPESSCALRCGNRGAVKGGVSPPKKRNKNKEKKKRPARFPGGWETLGGHCRATKTGAPHACPGDSWALLGGGWGKASLRRGVGRCVDLYYYLRRDTKKEPWVPPCAGFPHDPTSDVARAQHVVMSRGAPLVSSACAEKERCLDLFALSQ